jgi:hypothetical protein
LVCIELRLSLLVSGLQALRLDVALLGCQITRSFGFHNGLTATTERTLLCSLRSAASTGNVCLALGFSLLYVNNALHVRRHVLLGILLPKLSGLNPA